MTIPKYIVITPVRDEAAHISRTIGSMAQQTILPVKWIIINDGSTDNTPQILHAASKRYDWIYIVDRPNRGYRKSGSGVIEAFYDGYDKINGINWDYLVKLDGDLSFEKDYFEKCFFLFWENEKLGIGGGTICLLNDGHLKIDSEGDPPFHVRGATKIYRRECWAQISPLIQAPGWDTVDEVKANMHGWITRTFNDLVLIQHKQTGGADGNWRNFSKNGMANYITGYHPLFMFAKCIKRAFRPPFLIGSIALLTGFLFGYMSKEAQIKDKLTIRYLRKEQLRRMMGRQSIYG
jgi:glycosyltransferase involved in cell wall biosynthesis